MRSAWCLVMGLVVVGCGEKAPPPAAQPQETPEAALKAFAEKALPAVVKAIPAGAPEVKFEAALSDKDRIAFSQPVGWTTGVIPGSFEPPKEADLGFGTRFRVGTNCDGTCEPKEWPPIAEKVNFKQYRSGTFKIVTEEALTAPEGRLIIAEPTSGFGKKIYLSVARWKAGESRYFTCSATLDGEKAAALLPAFREACQVARPRFLE